MTPQKTDVGYTSAIPVWFLTRICSRERRRCYFRTRRSSRLQNLELCLKAYAPGISPNLFGDPVSLRTPSRPPKSECNEAGLLWNATLERDTRLLIGFQLERPFLAGHGIRAFKDFFSLRTLTLRELMSPKELQLLPLPSGFCSSLEELAEEFEGPSPGADLVKGRAQVGMFPDLLNTRSFIDRVAACINTEEQPVIEQFPYRHPTVPRCRRIRFTRATSGPSGRRTATGSSSGTEASKFSAVPDAVLTMFSDEMPVTGSQVDLLLAELFRGPKRTRVSVVECTSDLEGRHCEPAHPEQVLHRARRTKFIEDLEGRQTFYIGGRQSDAQGNDSTTKCPETS